MGSKGGQWLRAVRAAVLGGLLCAPTIAQAQEEFRVGAGNGDGADTHLFRPAVDSKGFFTMNGSDILGANDISFGLVLDYGRNLLRIRDGAGDVPLGADGAPCERGFCTDGMMPPNNVVDPAGPHGVEALVDDSFQGTWGFNYGVANAAVVGVTVPLVLMTGDPAYGVGPDGAEYNTLKLDEQSISTVAFHGKLRLTRVEKGIGVAVLLQTGFPIGDSPKNLGADPGFWYWPQGIIEKRFGATGRFKVGLNLGYRGHTGSNARFGSELEEGVFEYGNLGTFSLGFAWRALDSLDLVGETYGTMLLGGSSDSAQKLSQELSGGIKLFVERNSYLMMGGGTRAFSTGFEAADLRLFLGFVYEPSIGDRDGDGYKDDEDQCPDEPEDFDDFKDEDGCPDPDNDNDGILDVDDRCPNTPEDFDGDEDEDGCPEGSDADNDKDGILDVDDKCPNDPEDKDGFEDEDGCPDEDNDSDGIFDVEDQCPNDPETYNGHEDEDGCPDKGKVIIEGSDIMILEKIQFATGSARILPQSIPIIEAVAATLKGHPEFLVIEIAGHADERSSDEYNLKLTRDRAASVVEALTERGVTRNRLVSQGYGEYCPLDDASNPIAWEKNRRVEFKVVKTEDGQTGVSRGCPRARSNGVIPPRVK